MNASLLPILLLPLIAPLPAMAQTDADSVPVPVQPQVLGEPIPPPPIPVEPPPETVPLAQWLEATKAQMPDHICQDKGEWLACFDLEPGSCNERAERISALCVDILAENMPTALTEAQAARWSIEAARCFNLTFLNLHQETLKDDESCQTPPAHLR